MIRIHFLARKCQQQLKFVTSKFHVRTDCTDSDEGLVTTQLQIATEMTAVPKRNSSSCRCDCVAEVGRHEETPGLKRHTGCNVSSRLEPGRGCCSGILPGGSRRHRILWDLVGMDY